MEYYISETTQEELETLYNNLKQQNIKGGKSVGFTHLKMSLFDWRVENHWNREGSFVKVVREVGTNKILGGGFWTFTKREPRHVTFRHVFIFEPYRGLGLAHSLYDYRINHSVEHGMKRIRMFSNIPALDWHLSKGMRFIGYNKSKQPFTYLPLFEVSTIKELGKKYTELGYEKCIELVRPEVDLQMNKLITRGGRWFTSQELQDTW